MLEALCRQSSTTLDIVHAEDGPPITQRTSGLGGDLVPPSSRGPHQSLERPRLTSGHYHWRIHGKSDAIPLANICSRFRGAVARLSHGFVAA